MYLLINEVMDLSFTYIAHTINVKSNVKYFFKTQFRSWDMGGQNETLFFQFLRND